MQTKFRSSHFPGPRPGKFADLAPGMWNLLASKDGQFGDVLLKRLPGLLREQKRLREEQGVKVSIEELLRGELDERKREQYKAQAEERAKKQAKQRGTEGATR